MRGEWASAPASMQVPGSGCPYRSALCDAHLSSQDQQQPHEKPCDQRYERDDHRPEKLVQYEEEHLRNSRDAD